MWGSLNEDKISHNLIWNLLMIGNDLYLLL